MKIYTKAGDKGKTKLIGGSPVEKSDIRLEAYGSVDELNSVLGLVLTEIKGKKKLNFLIKNLFRIQNELFNLGSLLACEDKKLLAKLPTIKTEHILLLEAEIDAMTEPLPKLKNFILPGGSKSAAFLHLARTVCRRTERATVRLCERSPENEIAVIYLNRLGDYLFVAARFCNHKLGIKDRLWQK